MFVSTENYENVSMYQLPYWIDVSTIWLAIAIPRKVRTGWAQFQKIPEAMKSVIKFGAHHSHYPSKPSMTAGFRFWVKKMFVFV